ncbi:uncharacterized protein N7515_004751 [Penicillium bovifimosum]|uniref:Copper-fist domain-containing protein n=1 Tax=Penicillium bovifimosum TaxID=126998 RepID=A0A9W9H298_9EURO|nr:uncharacterized protein N7515_004751 [Penicillium bovifimosum]KAJ5135473.1 hypothetical protein N7515_004751 [Penicillium bovifimosum]
MPLDEEGAKWSCEPCIRGHRSSKCQHFDRLMMKVPKAGRPLAKCPHPKGTCSCQKTYAVMVRIPKGSSCVCRPLYKVPMDANESTQSTPPSMASSSSPAGKIQKSGRRQSTMQAAPQNIARALENMPNNVKVEEGTSNQMADPYRSPIADTQIGETPSPQESSKQKSQSPQVSSCCSQKPMVPPSAPVQTPAPEPAQNGGSCCGGSGPSTTNQTVHTAAEADRQQYQQPAVWDGQTYMQFSTPHISSWQDPTVPMHGNYMHSAIHQEHAQPPNLHDGYLSMRPQDPQRTMSHMTPATSLAYPNPMNGLGINQSSMGPYMLNNSEPFYAAPSGGDAFHDCSCGDDCQCLGCAAHPFNTTTQKHVQEMGALVTFNDGDKNSELMNSYQPSPYQPGTPTTQYPYFMQNTPTLDHGFQPLPFESYSDPNSTLPSGYSSPLSSNQHHLNQQLMHDSQYLTLEYAVGLPSTCSDVTGSCQCGSDCSCVGCLTHNGHNGIPLDMPNPEQPTTHPPVQHNQTSHYTPHTSSAPSQTSRIPVLDNMSVPCLSPRTLETSMI